MGNAADHAILTERLSRAFPRKAKGELEHLAGELGFAEPRKTASNLQLLHEDICDPAFLAHIVLAAQETADPDLAVNSLERLTSTVHAEHLRPTLENAIDRHLLLTILGASPFFAGILCRRDRFFLDLFPGGEVRRCKDEKDMLADLRTSIPGGVSFSELQKGLRIYKSREVLRIGARDLCGLSDLSTTTAELSALAAASLQRAYEICTELLISEHGPPLLDQPGENGSREPEFTILGMGKLGGRELNFSSDIDLIYFYSSEKGMTRGVLSSSAEPEGRIHLHQYFCRLAEVITRALGQVTEDGFVFRVDLRLRPDGDSGEMANSLRSAETYYESWGQSWERTAMIKARPVAGSIPFGEKLLQDLQPFIYRRYLDYAMIEDIRRMKQKIDRSLTREKEGELNLKLGRGGIREIEFFIQTLQLVYGGKNPRLRERNSLSALDSLHREGLIESRTYDHLREAYSFLRTVEHRIQMVQERQTHNLPVRREEIDALARRCGFLKRKKFLETLEEHRQNVEAIYRDLFFTSEEEIREEVRPEIAFLFDPAADPDLVMDLLEERGFRNPRNGYESIAFLRDAPPRAHLTQRARRQLERIAPLLMQEVIDSPEPDRALLNLERFLRALRARATFYALLAENREIIKVLVSLFGTSQFLSRIFIQHPEILDSMVSRSYAVSNKDRITMEKDLEELIGDATDYEDRLDVLRRFRNEEFLRIAMGDLYGNLELEEVARQLSVLADVALNKAVSIAREELMPRFGIPWCKTTKGDGHEAAFAIIGMGKLGGMELNYHSDVDIIFVYEGNGETRPAPGADPHRFRLQTNQEYFSRLAQRIISVLTLSTREGFVYQIDTRLRPSGNQGPLVTSMPAFRAYHESSARMWERQALTKSRVVTGPERFVEPLSALLKEMTYGSPLGPGLKEEIYRLRNRMEVEIAREDRRRYNIKTGRGGMVDVEFIVQYLQLLHGGKRPDLRLTNTLDALDALQQEKLLSKGDYDVLKEGYRFLRKVENRLRLVHDQSVNELSGDPDYLTRLARRLGYPEGPKKPASAFLEDYRSITEEIRRVYERILGAPPDIE